MPGKLREYLRIKNDIVEGLMRQDLSGGEFRVLLAIIRRSYGWNKKEARVTVTKLQELTGLHKQSVYRSLASLVRKGVLVKLGKDVWAVDKSVDNWEENSQIGYKSVAKMRKTVAKMRLFAPVTPHRAKTSNCLKTKVKDINSYARKPGAPFLDAESLKTLARSWCRWTRQRSLNLDDSQAAKVARLLEKVPIGELTFDIERAVRIEGRKPKTIGYFLSGRWQDLAERFRPSGKPEAPPAVEEPKYTDEDTQERDEILERFWKRMGGRPEDRRKK